MKLSDRIVALTKANGGTVNVLQVAAATGLPLDEACYKLARCIERGLLMPYQTALFGLPTDEGLPPAFEGKAKESAIRNRHNRHFPAILEHLESSDVGLAVTDAQDVLDLANQKAREVLVAMEKQELLISRESRRGGSAHRPRIWGLNEEQITAREAMYPERGKKKKGKSSRQAPVEEMTWQEVEQVDFGDE